MAKKIGLWLAYSVAMIVILAATLVSLSRMLTPYLSTHRHEFELWASEQLHLPVTIQEIRITWYYLRPVLTFDNVAILDASKSKPNFKIQQIKVNLQILPSLLHWQPIPQYIKIFGANLVLRELSHEKMSVEGLKQIAVIDVHTGGGVNANAATTWVLSQPHLVLDDINVIYIPMHGEKRSITLDKLSLKNTASEHELSGNAMLNQAMPLDIQFNIQVQGNVNDLAHLKGKSYFYLEGISLPQWLKNTTWQHLQLLQGIGSAKLWVYWDQDKLQSINSELQFYDLEIKSLLTKKILNISRMNGKLGWRQNGTQHIITGTDIMIDFPEHLWPATGFNIKVNETADKNLTLQALTIDYIDLADAVELVLASGFVPADVEKILDSLNLDGEVRALQIHQVPTTVPLVPNSQYWMNHTISADFAKLSFATWHNIPEVKNLTGSMQWQGQQGQLKLNSQQTLVNLTKLFPNAFYFERLSGDINLQSDTKNGWIVSAKKLQVKNDKMNLATDFIFTSPVQDASSIDLNAQFAMTDTTTIDNYMPIKIMDPPLAHWLQNTFYGGKISNGYVILQGNLTDFPFDNNNGKFAVGADISNLDFEFAPAWPAIKKMNGKLLFSGHAMTVEVTSGQMLDIHLDHVQAEIPYIGAKEPQILNIHSVINTGFPQALSYVAQSPLQKTLGKNLTELQLSGDMKLDLNLSIPLKTPENTAVAGHITIPNSALNFPNWDAKLEKINGELNFTDKEISATHLNAILFNQPIQIDVHTLPAANDSSIVAVSFENKINKTMLQNRLHLPASNLFQGAATYKVQLNLTSEKQSLPDQLIVSSDLQGIAINLPSIYGKKAEEVRPLQFIVNMDKEHEDLDVQMVYGDVLSAAITFKKTENKAAFYNGELRLSGAGKAKFQTKPGLLITGQFDSWDWNVWQGYLAALQSTSQSTHNHFANQFNLNMLRGVSIDAKAFSAFGLNLHVAHIQALQDKTNWSIKINSDEMMGQVLIPFNLKQAIQANFQHLYFASVASNNTSLFDVKKLPPITFQATDVRYGDMNFGGVEFNTIPTSSGLLIQSLHCYSPYYNLSAKGEWRSTKNTEKTSVQGNLTTKDAGKLLQQWGMASNLVESGGNLQFNLNWMGAPYHPDLNSVAGNLSLDLTAGRIVDLGNATDAKMGIGKMLNLFNLSTLPRRLTLNFKDFKNGYSFDSMRGDFKFKNGSLYTDKTIFDGPIAKIEFAGRIGYVAKDYDVDVSVTPYGVTSSLPIVATVVGGPVAGAATWLVDRVVGGAVSNVITHRYRVQGAWNNPQWIEQ